MKKRELTCIVCPRGCSLSVELDDTGAPITVRGNLCKRGEAYATDECVSPKRMVTSTVRCKDGGVVSCKTSSSVPKALVFDVMRIINTTIAENDVKIGDVLVRDILGTGADIVVTANRHI